MTASFDARDLRNALGTFATGVAIITTRDAAGRLYGLTGNSFTSISLDPPLVLWSLSCSAPSLSAFREATHFGVNVLAMDQRELAVRFARAQRDKFEGVEYTLGAYGVPLIDGRHDLPAMACAQGQQRRRINNLVAASGAHESHRSFRRLSAADRHDGTVRGSSPGVVGILLGRKIAGSIRERDRRDVVRQLRVHDEHHRHQPLFVRLE